MKRHHILPASVLRVFISMTLITTMLSLTACNHQGTNEDSTSSLFPLKDYQEVQAVQVFPDIIMRSPVNLLVINDNLLIAQVRNDSLIQVIDLNDKTLPYMIAGKGAGPDEFYEIYNLLYFPKDSMLAIYDRNYRSYSYYKVNKNNIETQKSSFIRKDFLKQTRINSYATPLGEGYLFYEVNDGKMFSFKNKEQEVLKNFGEYPGKYPGTYSEKPNWDGSNHEFTNDDIFSLTHAHRLTSSPDMSHAVVAGIKSDWLAFFKEEKGEVSLLKQFFSHDTYNIASTDPFNTGHHTIFGAKSTEKTLLTYAFLYPTEKYCYALYYGFPELDKDNPDNTCYILQFDWEGNYQKAYHLQEVINRFAVDEQRNCIYATYTAKGEDPVLLKYEIK